MGAALVGGLVANGWAAGDLAVVEVVPERRDALPTMFPVGRDQRNCSGMRRRADRGQAVRRCGRGTAAAEAGARRVLSIAAGVSVDTLQKACGDGVAVVRSIPNTPALLGKGAAAICGGPFGHRRRSRLGRGHPRRGRDGRARAGAASRRRHRLVGDGPAYLFLVAEALTDAGVLAGLTRRSPTRWCVSCSSARRRCLPNTATL